MPSSAEALQLLDIHYKMFHDVKAFAEKYAHPHPMDTRGWSQILVSSLTQIKGIGRKKGADLEDGSELIAYYEEGSSANIRVKRFMATAKTSCACTRWARWAGSTTCASRPPRRLARTSPGCPTSRSWR